MRLLPLFLILACPLFAQPGVQPNQNVLLPNGWTLSPAGQQIPLGDFPMNMVLSPDGSRLAITHNGVGRQHIRLFDTRKNVQLHDLTLPKLWYGLAFSPDGKRLYAAAGTSNAVDVLTIDADTLRRDTVIRLGQPWPNPMTPSGLALDRSGEHLYVCTREDSALHRCNTRTLQPEQRLLLRSPAYACAMHPDGTELYASLWGRHAIAVIDPVSMTVMAEITVGEHPNEILLNADGSLLFVANALDNSVSVIDTRRRRQVKVLNCALYPDAPNGSTTNGLALSPDEKRLYVANADNNCLAVFEVDNIDNIRSLGFVPTGWYPTAVRCLGNNIYVANGKGLGSLANPDGPNPLKSRRESPNVQYIGSLMQGTLGVIPSPDEPALLQYAKQVYSNTPYTKEKELTPGGQPGNPIPMRVGEPSPIKYVFYIIKENRTYDQVLGDMPEGNGDAALCLFPEKITPNQHALAREFVLLDNFYVDAEVSADGHNWSMGAYANDYVEKKWPTSYGGRGGSYDFEGGLMAHPKGGYFWDNCKRHQVSYRTYGEFVWDSKPSIATVRDNYCVPYPSYSLEIQDTTRARIWAQDFDSLLAIGQLPRFNSIRMGNDHTSGLRKGAYSPFAAVADNDLGVGMVIEHLSKSPVWQESVVFILEDDAQNGADHVDAHRSICFVAGPHVKRGLIDHTMYSTSSVLRTMELILGLPPMSQYDAAATPMWRCFTDKPDTRAYVLKPNLVNLDERNAAVDNEWTRLSETFNLVQFDAVPERLFNEVLWKAVKGFDSDMPAPRVGAFVRVTETEE